MPPSADNPKGYFEPSAIVHIHDHLLYDAGSHWTDWDPLPASWYDSSTCKDYVARLVEAVNQDFPGSGPFLLKDPRLCRFIDIWLTVLDQVGCEPVVLFQYRDPYEVAASLKAREGFSMEQGLLLWLRHNLDAEHRSRSLPRTFVSYDATLLDWQSELAPLVEKLRPSLPKLSATAKTRAEEFLDSSLRHHRRLKTARLNRIAWVDQALAALERLRIDAQDNQVLEELDSLRSQFNDACGLFSPIWHSVQTRMHRLEQDKASSIEAAAARDETINGLTARIEAAEGNAGEAATQMESLQTAAMRMPALEAELEAAGRSALASQSQIERAAIMEAELACARSEVASSNARLQQVSADFETMRQTSDGLLATSEKIPMLEENLRHAEAALAALRPMADHAARLEAELSQARSDNTSLVVQAERALADTRAAHETMHRLACVADQVPILESEVAQAKERLRALPLLEERARDLTKEVAAAHEEIQGLRQSLTALQTGAKTRLRFFRTS